MAGDDEDKTEEPTGRKLDRARDEGQTVSSQEVKVWASLLGATLAISMFATILSRDLLALMRPFIESPHAIPADFEHLRRTFFEMGLRIGLLMLLPLGVIAGVGIAATLGQSGFLWVTKKIMPDPSKISPFSGLKRMFSMRSILDLVKGILKIVIVAIVMYVILSPRLPMIEHMTAMEPLTVLGHMRDLVLQLMIVTLIVMAVIAGADYLYTRFEFMKQMRMTKQEVKDDVKQQEGDPQVKGRIRGLRRQRARQRMMSMVPKADVVVTNPTHYAVALTYDMDKNDAPILVAKGADLLAKRIREIAEEHEVPIVENPPLARALYATVELEQEVPPQHYKAVAEVIGYVMRLKGRLKH